MKRVARLAILWTVLVVLSWPAVVQAQFNYSDNGDGTCTITRYTGLGGVITIPSETNGLTVVGIGPYAFQNCFTMTRVVIPSSVFNIGEWAFTHCTSLSSAAIPNNVTNVGFGAFCNCSSLSAVTIGNNVPRIEGDTFAGCSILSSITIPDSVDRIGPWAFMNCTRLAHVTMHDNVKNLDLGAFYGCSSLTRIDIPVAVTSIWDYTFYGCSGLTAIYFASSPPDVGSRAFNGDTATVYYLPWTIGWGQTFGGLPTEAMLVPVALDVISAKGGATPGPIITNAPYTVSESITNSPIRGVATQYVCSGGSVVGNDFTLVNTTNVMLTLTNNATLTWTWQTQYRFTTTVIGPGNVTSGGWFADGSNAVATATAHANSHLVKWVGNTSGCVITGNMIAAPMTQARTIAAVFAFGAPPVISGKVTKSGTSTGVAGVTITFSGGIGTATTDISGDYAKVVPYKWTGTVTASFTNGGFGKSVLTCRNLTKEKMRQNFNFIWVPPPVISGRITQSGTSTGVAGVVIAFSGVGTTMTSTNGNFAMTVPYKWTGTARPSTNGVGGFFSPAIKSYSSLLANSTAQRYAWTAPVASILSKAAQDGLSVSMLDGFAQWVHARGLAGSPDVLFDQINSAGVTYGAEYAFGDNLADGEPIVQLLKINDINTVVVPRQNPTTLLDVNVTVEFTSQAGSGYWFPAMCLPYQAATPLTKQWFQPEYGDAAEFRVIVRQAK